MGLQAQQDELVARLSYDARTQQNYERYLGERDQRLDDVSYLPTRLDIENVSRCNFACSMCAVSGWKHRKRAEDMTLESFKALIDEQYGLVEIKLNGLGEALMQGDDYFEMIRYARARRIWVRMTTNASLLGVNQNIQKLIDSGVNDIDISIDGADAATYEKIRVGGSFERVIYNCSTLNYAYEVLGLEPHTKMWTLVQEKNAHNLLAHVHLASRLGFKHLVFSLTMHGWGDPELATRNKFNEMTISRKELDGLSKRGEELGVRVAFWTVADKFTRKNLCPWPFERAVVTSDSRVTPCCMIGNPDAYEIKGGKTVSEIWLSSNYQQFRQMHINGNLPDVCKGCYHPKDL